MTVEYLVRESKRPLELRRIRRPGINHCSIALLGRVGHRTCLNPTLRPKMGVKKMHLLKSSRERARVPIVE